MKPQKSLNVIRFPHQPQPTAFICAEPAKQTQRFVSIAEGSDQLAGPVRLGFRDHPEMAAELL